MFNWLKNLFNKFVSFFKDLLSAALPVWKQILIGQMSKFAVQVVSELTGNDMTDDEKRAAAFARLKEFAEQNAIEAKDSLINFTIELAYQKLKA